jgi:hypothetical protein
VAGESKAIEGEVVARPLKVFVSCRRTRRLALI